MTATKYKYILIDHTHTHWPGLPAYRSVGSRGYRSEQSARDRARQIMTTYAAKHGTGGPDLRVHILVS